MGLSTRTTNSAVLALAAGALGTGWGAHEVLAHDTGTTGTALSAVLLLANLAVANLAVAGSAGSRLRPQRQH